MQEIGAGGLGDAGCRPQVTGHRLQVAGWASLADALFYCMFGGCWGLGCKVGGCKSGAGTWALGIAWGELEIGWGLIALGLEVVGCRGSLGWELLQVGNRNGRLEVESLGQGVGGGG